MVAGGDHRQFSSCAGTQRRATPSQFTSHNGSGFHSLQRRTGCHRQPGVGNAAISSGRQGRPSRTASSGAPPVDEGEVQRTASSGRHLRCCSDVIPFPLTAWAVRALTRLPQRGVVTLATNVPGPRQRLRIVGREVVRVLPIPPIALQLRTGIAIVSYADELVFGITADYDATPDVDELARRIEQARLVALSQSSD